MSSERIDKEFAKLLKLVNATNEAEKKAKKEWKELEEKRKTRTNITTKQVEELKEKYEEAKRGAVVAKGEATEAAIAKRKASEAAERKAALEREELINELREDAVGSKAPTATTKTAAQLKFEEEFRMKEALKEAKRTFLEHKTKRIKRFKNITALPRNNVGKLLDNIDNLGFEFNNDANEDKIAHFVKLAHAANMNVSAVIKVVEKGLPYTSEEEGISFFKSIDKLDLNRDEFVDFVVSLNRKTGITVKEILDILDEIQEDTENRNLDRSYYSDAQIRDIIILAYRANVPVSVVVDFLNEEPEHNELKLSQKVIIMRLSHMTNLPVADILDYLMRKGNNIGPNDRSIQNALKVLKNTKENGFDFGELVKGKRDERRTTKKNKREEKHKSNITNKPNRSNTRKTNLTIGYTHHKPKNSKASYASTVARQVEAIKDTFTRFIVRIEPITKFNKYELTKKQSDKLDEAIKGYFTSSIFKMILTDKKDIPKKAEIDVDIPLNSDGFYSGYALITYKDHKTAKEAYDFMRSDKEKPLLNIGNPFNIIQYTIQPKHIERSIGV